MKLIRPDPKQNYTILETNEGAVLFSYETPVAALVNNKWYVTTKQHSKTTSKHINNWLLRKLGNRRKTEPIISKPQEFFDQLFERVIITVES